MNRSGINFGSLLERINNFISRNDMMLQLETQFFPQRMPQSTKTAVMVIGGAEDKVHGRQILHAFFQRAGGTDAQIAIIPCASRDPEAIGLRYQDIF